MTSSRPGRQVFHTVVAVVALLAAGCATGGRTPKAPEPEPFGDLFKRTTVLTAPQPKLSYVGHIDVSPDGELIAGRIFAGGKVTVWNAQTSEVKWHAKVISLVGIVAFTRNGYLVTDPSIRPSRENRALASVYNATTGESVADIKWPDDLPAARMDHIAVAPTGGEIAISGDPYGEIFVYETNRWTLARRYGLPKTLATALAYSPDGGTLAVGTSEGMVVLLDRLSGEVTRAFKAHKEVVEAIAFGADGSTFLTSSWNKDVNDLIKLWGVDSIMVANPQYLHGNRLADISFDSSGDYAVTAGGYPEIFSFTQRQPTIIQRLPVSGPVYSVRGMGHCFVIPARDRVEVWCRGEK